MTADSVGLTTYTPERPLLLVTDYPPNAGGGGAVILRSLLGPDDRRRVLWAHPAGPAGAPPPASPDAPSAVLDQAGGLRALLRRRSLLADSVLAGQVADAINTLARARRARGIWVVAHGAMTHAAAHLVRRADVPVHLTVHDDPAYGVALMSRRYLGLVPLIARDFGRAIRGARSVDVVSAGMARRYRERYGVDAAVVHRGLPDAVVAGPAHADARVIEIGVLGNTYGFDQLPLLAESLQHAATSAGATGRLVVLGQGQGERLRSHCAGRLEVEVPGHLDEPAAVERLRRCFLLYLNYPFSWRAAVLRATSFPTKLSTYLQAARPLLAHAPVDSSIVPLRELTGYTHWWADEQVERGAQVILQAWRDAQAHTSQHLAAESVRRRFYDLDGNRAALFGTLNRLPGA